MKNVGLNFLNFCLNFLGWGGWAASGEAQSVALLKFFLFLPLKRDFDEFMRYLTPIPLILSLGITAEVPG